MMDRRSSLKTLGLGWLALQAPGRVMALGSAPLQGVAAQAMEISEFIQKSYWDAKRGIFADKLDKPGPAAVWGAGVVFSSLVAGARHDSRFLPILKEYFKGLDAYWDAKAKIPGYEPFPTAGDAHDKYYDDNAWMVLTFLEAYELTSDPKLLSRAKETLKFVLSGEDDTMGGGVWWHELHHDDSKNTCSNGPSALGCFKLARFYDPKTAATLFEKGKKIVEWTVKTLQAPNALFNDKIQTNGTINHGQLTYNTALMLRCILWLHTSTGDAKYLAEANRIAKAADGFLDSRTGAYRDSPKWSHLMVEADIEMYRHTRQTEYLERAKKTSQAHYESWKSKPADEVINNASFARELWLLADLETPAGVKFWEKSDKAVK